MAITGKAPDLLLLGQAGRGKTYAACALIIALLPSMRGMFAKTKTIMDQIRGTHGSIEDEWDVIHRWANVPLLVMDDFDKVHVTEWSLPHLWDLIDSRTANGKLTIYTSQASAADLKRKFSVASDPAHYAEAIISRLKACQVIYFNGPDRRQPCR